MPDANHFDAVASKHGDPHTRFMDNAVDDADDEAEAPPVAAVPVVPVPGEQVGSVPPAPARVQPPRRDKRIKLYLTDDEFDMVAAKARKAGVAPAMLLRTTLVEMIGGWHGLDRRAGNAPAAADAARLPGGRGETESLAQDEGA